MRAADIFLQPSRTADNGNTEGGAPITLIDAQSVGLAICSTTHADIPEVAPHGVSALLSPERDPGALTQNLLKLATDRALRQRLGQGGRNHVSREYNWAIQGPRLAEIYRSLLS
jgi:colanic acid/amylovoran biosynthesis glycosyltransferase